MKLKLFVIFSIIYLISTPCLYSKINSNELVAGKEIYKIEFFGNKVVKDDRISDIIGSQIGTIYDDEIIKKDIKELYKTSYFYKIDIVTKLINEKVLLIFRFEENPVLADIRISGNDALVTNWFQ